MAADYLVPGGILSMTAGAADRLLAAGHGDAALLYLCLLRRGEGECGAALKWPADRLEGAWAKLTALGLAVRPQSPPVPVQQEPTEPPDYTTADITQELASGAPFACLTEEVQRRLGKFLNSADLKILYTLYDYLALPPEVIVTLVTWCVREAEEKYGPGRRPTMTQVRREGFAWRRKGIDTQDGVERYLKELTCRRTAAARLLPLVGVTHRGPVEGEQKYLDQWVAWGFEEDALRLAYEKTVLKKQSMNWPYMNSILKSWQQKGLLTVEAVRSGDSTRRAALTPLGGQATPPTGAADQRVREDFERMRKFLEGKKQEEGK